MDIPAKYSIRAYLREQSKLAEALVNLLCDDMPVRWLASRLDKFPKDNGIAELGGYFGDRVRELGAFSVHETHTVGTRNLPHRERYDVNGYFVEPITLGSLADQAMTEHFAEDAILLRTINCTFKSKKASNGLGFSGIALPSHVLERIYERTEISREAFPNLIVTELDDMLKGLAVAKECGIAVSQVDGSFPYWITAIPFANGLLIVKMKFVMGGFKERGFGFRLEMPSGYFFEPYTSPNRMMTDFGGFHKDVENSALLDCAVTYFNVTTLSEAQSSYYYKFQQLKIEIGDNVLSTIARHIYEPRLPHEPHIILNLSGKPNRLAEELKIMIDGGWIKPKDEYPFSALLPFQARPIKNSMLTDEKLPPPFL